MSGWTADFKKGFFTGAGVLAAVVAIGWLAKKV
jgi:hypothetical protein